jgi:hypothetical protein
MLTPRIKPHGRAFAHIAAFHPELTALRRDLHAHPEIGFEEHYTAQRVVGSLMVRGVGRHSHRQRQNRGGDRMNAFHGGALLSILPDVFTISFHGMSVKPIDRKPYP